MLLTIACPAGPQNYQKLHVKAMDAYLDMWNLMAYDYAGSWDTVAGHQSNIFSSRNNPATTPFSTHQAVDFYKSHGVHPSKIIIGMPLYGRAFASTDGLGKSFSGTGEGSWEQGVWDVKVLPKEGAQEFWDEEAMASYSYDGVKRVLVSYDSVGAVVGKADWIRREELGGGMWWETSGDGGGEGSRISTVSYLAPPCLLLS